MDIVAIFKAYLEDQKNYSEHTVTSYLKDIQDFSDFIQTEELARDLLDVKRERLARHFLSHMDQVGLSRKTIARKISALRTFYDFLVKESYIEQNVFTQLEIPKIPKKLPVIIHDEELKVLFESIDQTTPLGYRNYVMLDLLFSCGLRASELVNITIRDLQLEQSQILIHGKGSKDRFVPLHDDLVSELKHYLTYIRPILLSKGLDVHTSSIFINYKGGILTVRGLQVILKKMIEKTGDVYNIHPHMLRHAFATTLLDHGADLRVVQELLGHEHLKSTQIYTHVSKEKIQETYNKTHPRMIKKGDKHEKI
jgi:integrase/recombinase XerC